MDIGTISSAYSAVKAIKELGAALLDEKIGSEARLKIAEVMDRLGKVQDTLFHIREELVQFQEENHALKEKISNLEERLEEKGKIKYEKPSYWIVDDGSKDGPFCQRCYDSENNLVRLQGGKNDTWVCYACKSIFHGPNYTPPKSRRVIHKGIRGRSWLSDY